MTEIGINDERPTDKPYLVIADVKIIVFDSEEEKTEYLNTLIIQNEILE